MLVDEGIGFGMRRDEAFGKVVAKAMGWEVSREKGFAGRCFSGHTFSRGAGGGGPAGIAAQPTVADKRR